MASEQTRKRLDNQARLLDLFRRRGVGRRSAMSDELGIRKSSVTSICRELLDRNILLEREPGAFRSPLSLDPAYWRAGVLDLQPDRTITSVINVEGQIEAREEHILSEEASPAQQLEAAAGFLKSTIEQAGGHVLGVGCSLPGITDPEKGRSLSAVNLLGGWTDVEVAGPLEAELGVGVLIENDATCQLLGNWWFKPWGKEQENAIYLSIDEGIGCAQLTDGRPVRGRHFAAGEIGCLPSGGEGRPCACGKSDCLQTYCAIGPLLKGMSVGTADELAKAVDGSKERAAALSELLRPLADKLATIIAMSDPDVLVIATESEALTSQIRLVLSELMRDSLQGLHPEKISVQDGFACSNGSLLGGATVVFEQAFGTAEIGLVPTA